MCTSKGTTYKWNQYDSLKNSDFIDIGNFEVRIYFRDLRVYYIGLIAVRDESPLTISGCAGASFFSGVYSWLVMTFNYLILWVRVKGQG